MKMKWTPIVDGDLRGIPIDEEFLFTIFDEEDGETYVEACWTEEGFDGSPEVRSGARYFKAKNVMAWMDFPLPYKPKNKCLNCKHFEEWCDEFGDRWAECDLRKNVPIEPGKCPLGR